MERTSGITLLLDTWFLAQTVTRWMQVRLAEVGLSADEMALCSVLQAVDGGSPTVLAEIAGSPLSTMTSMIGRLQRAGMLEVVPDPDDRRGKLVRLSAAGNRLLAEAQSTFAPAYWSLTESLSLPAEQIRTALNELEAAVRDDLGLEQRPDTCWLPAVHDEPLSPAQVSEVRRYVAWLRHRDRNLTEGNQQ
ncbi:MAG: MarR family winged helix-turn-helix transcriptional regulator [Micrococcales bacterium]|nr:MarR family winged helix-turn-helix transcriptional regulator [Micrococcales bacterium]